MKKILAILLAASMLLSTGVAASAATAKKTASSSASQSAEEYDYVFRVSKKKVASLTKNGKNAGTWDLKSTKVTLEKSTAGGISIKLTLDDGSTKKVSLGKSNALTIGGKFDTLTISSKVSKNAVITIDESAEIDDLKVSFGGKVTVEGEVDSINITTKTASVKVTNSASVDEVVAVDTSTITGVSSSIVELASDKYGTSNSTTDPDAPKFLGITDIVERENSVTFYCDVAGADIIANGKRLGATKDGKNTVSYTLDADEDLTIEIELDGYRTETIRILSGGYHNVSELEDRK